MIALDEVFGCNCAPDPKVTRWPSNPKGRAIWAKLNETCCGLVNSVKVNVFQAL